MMWYTWCYASQTSSPYFFWRVLVSVVSRFIGLQVAENPIKLLLTKANKKKVQNVALKKKSSFGLVSTKSREKKIDTDYSNM